MNPVQYQSIAHPFLPPQRWGPEILPNPPPASTFWNHLNVQQHLKDLHETLSLATSMQKELEMLMKVKEAKEYKGVGDDDGIDRSIDCSKVNEFDKFIEDNRIDLGIQELISVKAANGLMSKLRFLLEPFRVVTDDGSPWEEKSAVVRLNDKINKLKRNKLWRKRKRQRVAELLTKEGEHFENIDREADEWRAKEIAKDMALQKLAALLAYHQPSEKKRKLLYSRLIK